MRILTLLNHMPGELSADITLEGYVFERLLTWRGGEACESETGFSVTLPANTGAVAVIKKK